LVRFILKYFVIFEVVVNRINFLKIIYCWCLEMAVDFVFCNFAKLISFNSIFVESYGFLHIRSCL
jgi:hypothetical protein